MLHNNRSSTYLNVLQRFEGDIPVDLPAGQGESKEQHAAQDEDEVEQVEETDEKVAEEEGVTDQGVEDDYEVKGGEGGAQETGGRDHLEKPGLVPGGYTHRQDSHHTSYRSKPYLMPNKNLTISVYLVKKIMFI